MSRRPRRSGIKFIENEKDRHLTYFKRRAGLIKSSADLSTVTGGKSVVVLESERGKKSAFGTPSANAIIDSFLSEHNPYLDEGETAKITHMQDELFWLEKGKAVEDKKKRECKTHLKEIQDTSIDVEDLGATEVIELFQRLEHLQNGINNRTNAGKQLEVSGQTGPLPPHPLYSSLCHSQINMPPRSLPWVSLQESSQYSSLNKATIHSSSSNLSSIITSTTDTSTVHQQAHMTLPVTNEAHQPIHYFPQPQPSLLSLQAELLFNPTAQPDPNHGYTDNFSLNPVAPPHQNHEYTHNFNFNSVAPLVQDYACHSFNYNPDHANSKNLSASQQSASYEWHPVTTSIEPYSDPSLLDALSNCYFDLADDYGVQAIDGGHDVELDPFDLHAQDDDDVWFTTNLFGSPFLGAGDGA